MVSARLGGLGRWCSQSLSITKVDFHNSIELNGIEIHEACSENTTVHVKLLEGCLWSLRKWKLRGQKPGLSYWSRPLHLTVCDLADLAIIIHNPKAWRRWSWIEIRVLTLNSKGMRSAEFWVRQNQLVKLLGWEYVNRRASHAMIEIELLRAGPSRPKSQSSGSPGPCDRSNKTWMLQNARNISELSSFFKVKAAIRHIVKPSLSSSWLESSASKIWRVSCDKNNLRCQTPGTSSRVELKMPRWQSKEFAKTNLISPDDHLKHCDMI